MLNFHEFDRTVLDTLCQLQPALAVVAASLVSAQHFLHVAAANERSRSPNQRSRIYTPIVERGNQFQQALQRYRVGDPGIATDDQRVQALKNFFDCGLKVTQFIHLRSCTISKMCSDYSALVSI